ncbi:MAG: GNAT family N-acetyltransferase [Actinomycetales bacterium]
MTRTRTIAVVPMAEEDWQRQRELRLEMLADSPTAYVEALADAQAADEAEWRFRARRAAFPGSIGVIAVDRDEDRFVGTMSAYTDVERGRTWVVAVYVAPDYRGRDLGVADAMLDAVDEWAVAQGKAELYLEVHEDNGRAQAFYARRGFELTASTRPYDLDPSQRELEMRRALST